MRKLFQIKYIVVVLLIAGFFVLGVYVGFNQLPAITKVRNLSNIDTAVETKVDFSPFWKVWNDIKEKYPNGENVSDQDRVYGAISGLVSSLDDPYSVFFNPDETKSFQEDISGNFTGVGMEVSIKDKVLIVVAPLKNTPAEKAGVKSGDKIVKINDTTTADIKIEEAIKLIRGEKGTTVSLTVIREGETEPLNIKIIRDIINIPTLDTEKRDDGIFVIKLYSFTGDSANLFRNAMKEFRDANTDKLLLDLRGNPGGYLEAAVDIASWFLPKGKVVVKEDYGDNTKEKLFRSKGHATWNKKLKFTILIDGGSASASEIVAGALQDHKIAKLVGSQSFGKGSVQEVVNVTSDTILKITIAKWLTPDGHQISKKGLTPDYKIDFTKEDYSKKKDPQLEKAVQVLNTWQ